MRIPVGFKVNGLKVPKLSPRVQKVVKILDAMPSDELLTTANLADRVALPMSGGITQEFALRDYHEKVDSKVFWGSRKGIAQLRKQLAESEGTPDEN
jgi:hypothetical protein